MGQADIVYQTWLIWRYEPEWTDCRINRDMPLWDHSFLPLLQFQNVSYSFKVLIHTFMLTM